MQKHLTCEGSEKGVIAQADTETIETWHHSTVVPVAVADIQAVVLLVTEDVAEEVDEDNVTIFVLLPRLRPELGMLDHEIEQLRTDITATALELLAEVVANDSATILLLLGEERLIFFPSRYGSPPRSS